MYSQEHIEQLCSGAIGVLAADTIYGVVARALDAAAVERVYQVRGRRPEKPCIILISGVDSLHQFGVEPDASTQQILAKLWPGPYSVVLDAPSSEWSYLHRGTKTLAFRVPANEDLRQLLVQTGPLIAPSANPEGMKPAATIEKAREYFSDSVDFYDDAGIRPGEASTVVRIQEGAATVLRQGAAMLPSEIPHTTA